MARYFDALGVRVPSQAEEPAAWLAWWQQHVSGRLPHDAFAAALASTTTTPPRYSAAEVDALVDAKEREWRALVAALSPPIAPLPGVRAFLLAARTAGVPTALVTNAPRANVRFLLPRLGLGRADVPRGALFDVVVASGECAHAKPHPEPYRHALRRLFPSAAADSADAAAARAVVFEDTPAGIAAGKAAGCAVVAIHTGSNFAPADLRAAGADWIIPDYSALSLEALAQQLFPPAPVFGDDDSGSFSALRRAEKGHLSVGGV